MVTKANSATAIVEQLDAAEIQRRIAENSAERKALLVLLRAARAKDRSRKQPRAQEAAR
jgi:hypothetical protein